MSELAVEPGAEAQAPTTETVASNAAVDPVEPLAEGVAAGEATDGTPPEGEGEASPVEPRDIQAELQAELEAEWAQQQVAQQQQMAELLQRLASGQPTTPTPGAANAPSVDLSQLAGQLQDEYGNLNPAALIQLMQGMNQQTVAQAVQAAVAPLQQQLEQARTEQVQAESYQHYEQLVADMISDNASRNGDLSPKAVDLVESRAVQILDGLNSRYGTNPDGSARPKVLEMAIEQAAGEVRELLSEHGASSVQQHQNQLGTLAGVHGEAGTGAGAGVSAPVVKVGERSVDRFFPSAA